MNFKSKKRDEPTLDITALVDVVFLLLLFFMVTTQFITLPGLKITLPSVKPGRTVTSTSRVEVKVTAAGDIYFNGNPVTEEGLAKTLDDNDYDPESSVVVVMADAGVRHGRIVKLMDIMRSRGLRKIVLAAKWETEEGAK